VLLVFAADIDIPDDNVSICFAYTLPIARHLFRARVSLSNRRRKRYFIDCWCVY
jgi:hypothetical protein